MRARPGSEGSRPQVSFTSRLLKEPGFKARSRPDRLLALHGQAASQQLARLPENRKETLNGESPPLRPSGYVSRWEELWYGFAHPLYDLLTWWCFLPLGGERRTRREIVGWFGVEPGQRVLSLCCGTGTTERTLLDLVPDVEVTAVDLGTGQVARARRKDRSGRVDYRVGDASKTGLPEHGFDRVSIVLALHEMPRPLRRAVLREAARCCRPDGRVIAVEHGAPHSRAHRLARYLAWFYWLPGNPEVVTTFDLQRRGLAAEMEQAGLVVLERHQSRMEWIEGVVARPEVSGTISEGQPSPK